MANPESNTTTSSLWRKVLAKAAYQNIPSHVALELTYRCNLRCSHCYVDSTETDELSLEEWKQIIDQLKREGTIHLLFTGGEVFLRPDLFDILAYARHTGFVIHLLTNCTLITPEIADTLKKLRITDIVTSIYGATAVTHDTVTGINGSFEKTLDGMKLLAGAGITPKGQIVLMEGNATEYSQMKSLVADIGGIVQINIANIGPSKKGAVFPFQYEPGIETLLNCTAHNDIARDIVKKDHNDHLTCTAGLCTCSISPGGDVFPCVTFPLKLGSLRKSSFESIWRLEPCAELRYLRSMRRSDLYACRTCRLTEYCIRCTGFVYAETGRMNGPSPAACRQARLRWRLTQATEEAS